MIRKKTVLILADDFPPGFGLRMGYLAKFLEEHDWNGIVIAAISMYETRYNFDSLSDHIHIPCERIYIPNNKKKRSILHKVLSFFFPDMRIPWGVDKKMDEHINQWAAKVRFDIVLSSTYGLFPLNVAYKTARTLKIPWIADLRDIYEQYPIKGTFLRMLYNKIGLLRRNYLLRTASMITTVSKKHVEILTSYGLNACYIYNGADTDIFTPSSHHKFNEFRIVYTGVLSSSKAGMDISPLFSAIKQLYVNNDIDYKNCRIQFYSDVESQKIVNAQKTLFDISDFVDCFDFVPSAKIPKILNESAVLLLLLNKGSEGIMTTKFFEYLAVGRPILCIWSDEGEVKEIINSSGAGIAARTEKDIALFIKLKYDEWQKTGHTHSNIDHNYIKNISRKHNSKQFIKVFEEILERNKYGNI